MTNLMNSGKPKQWQDAGIIGAPILRIYQVTECDWWAGYDVVSVQEGYRKCVGEEADDYMSDFGMPEAIADEDLDDFIVTDDAPGQPKHTGREILAEIIASKREVPCFVACAATAHSVLFRQFSTTLSVLSANMESRSTRSIVHH